jgi:hypothetical protein
MAGKYNHYINCTGECMLDCFARLGAYPCKQNFQDSSSSSKDNAIVAATGKVTQVQMMK